MCDFTCKRRLSWVFLAVLFVLGARVAAAADAVVTTKRAVFVTPEGEQVELPIGSRLDLEGWSWRVTPQRLDLIPADPPPRPTRIFRNGLEG